jgi:hypothetical protein
MANFCFATDLQFEMDKIIEEYRYLMGQVLYEDPSTWVGRDFDINLVHRPDKEGRERYFSDTAKIHADKESEYTEFVSELRGGYLHKIYKTLNEQSKKGLKKFRLHNRGPGRYTSWHKDPCISQIYQMALWTNNGSILLGKKDENQESIHIPVDGKVWELNAGEYEHAVINMGNTYRCHLLASDWDE